MTARDDASAGPGTGESPLRVACLGGEEVVGLAETLANRGEDLRTAVVERGAVGEGVAGGPADCAVVVPDGWDLAAVDALARDHPDLPLVVCSRDPALAGEAFDAGATDFFELDGDPAVLFARVERAVSGARTDARESADGEAIETLARAAVDPDGEFPDALQRVLSTARERLGVEAAAFARVDREGGDGGTREVLVADHAPDPAASDAPGGDHTDGWERVPPADGEAGSPAAFEAGAVRDLSVTYCRKTVGSMGVMAVHDATAMGWAEDPAPAAEGVECYLGAKVVVEGETHGTVCFVDRSGRAEFSRAELRLAGLVADWAGRELARTDRERAAAAGGDPAATLSRLGDGVLGLDADGRCTVATARAGELLGFDPDDVEGSVLWPALPEGIRDRFRDAAGRAAERGEPASFTADPHGRPPVLECRFFPDGTGLSVSVRDVTGRTRRAATLGRLLMATRALDAADTREAVARTVAEAVAAVPGIDRGAVYLREGGSDRLEPATVALPGGGAREPSGDGRGDRSVATRATDHSPGEGPVGRAFEEGSAVVEDLREAGVDPAPYGGVRSAVFLALDGYGVLEAGVADGGIDRRAVSVVEVLAANAGAALARIDRQERLERYGQVFEAVEGLVYALDRSGRFTLLTEPLARRLGYDRPALVGEHVSTVLTEEGVERTREAVAELLRGDGESRVVATEAVTADGERVPVAVELSLLPTPEGEFRGVVGDVRDRSELERARSRLASERERFGYLFDDLPDPVVEVEYVAGEPLVRSVNPAFESVFGHDADAVRGRPLDDAVVPPGDDDGPAVEAGEGLRSGGVITREVRRETAEGTREFLFRGVPYRSGDRARAFAIYTDVNDRIRP